MCQVNHSELWLCGKMYMNNSNSLFLTTALNGRKWKHLQVTKLIRLTTVAVLFFFFSNSNNPGFCSYHNYHWRSLRECLLHTTKHCASTLEHRANRRVCKAHSSNPQSLWLGAQPLMLAAPSPIPAPFLRLRNYTANLQRSILSLWSSHPLATDMIAGTVRQSDELDWRTWTGLRCG